MDTSSEIIGRKTELERLRELCDSGKAQLLAVYGRRRVGKTFLVREFFRQRDCLYCAITGIKDAKMTKQLAIFQTEVERTFFAGERLPAVRSWSDAFEHLLAGVRLQAKRDDVREIVVFLDELPWLATRRSGILSAIDHAWNTQIQYIPKVRLVVCGSAASWMLENIIHAKGGLHNRLSGTFRLKPFSLSETATYLAKIRNTTFDKAQILELYMCIGGVPHYLSHVQAKYSATQNVGYLCFGDGELSGEFNNLFVSLFDKAQIHERIVRTLASKNSGMTRDEILQSTGILSGRNPTEALRELEEDGFIEEFLPTNRKHREGVYRIIDEFCLFHFRWIATAPSRSLLPSGIDHWLGQTQTAAFHTWAGYAFENICLKHSSLIKKKLDFAAVACNVGPWVYRPKKNDSNGNDGAQIDLLFDRADRVVTIVEIKYRKDEFVLTKSYKKELEKKVSVYRSVSKTKSSILIVVMTPFGVQHNEHSRGFISGVVTLEDLFVQ
jgi:hypothetical protein